MLRDPMNFRDNLDAVENAFNREALKAICKMDEGDFAEAFEMISFPVHDRGRTEGVDDFYLFRDNGADVLAVAHLDTVEDAWTRQFTEIIDLADGPVIYSSALDDRLGAFIILDLLPNLGINHDILLTVGEESGMSTAEFFTAQKQYNHMIEFDRGGTDVVMYQYEDDATIEFVRESGAKVGDGSFSDISYLEHLGIKGFNWGVGYKDYHGPRSHAYLDDTMSMVAKYLKFNELASGLSMPHTKQERSYWGASRRSYGSFYYTPWWEQEEIDEKDIDAEILDALDEGDVVEADRLFINGTETVDEFIERYRKDKSA